MLIRVHRRRGALACAIGALLLPSAPASERLPIRLFTAADGLPSNSINSITRDSHGFLWFATREGLARFDGYDFVSYGRANGLPGDYVSAFIQTLEGTYWAATPGGVAKFEPDAPVARKFIVYRRPSEDGMNVVYQDRDGNLWCGGESGLFRLLPVDASGREWRLEPVRLKLDSGAKAVDNRVLSIFQDTRRNLWIGTFHALYLRTTDGRTFESQSTPREGQDFLWNVVFEDNRGQLWAGTGFGLWRISARKNGDFSTTPVFSPKERNIVWDIAEAADGKLWLASSKGLIQWPPDGIAWQPRIYNGSNGLAGNEITALCLDRERNLWLGSEAGGAMRVAHNGFLTYIGSGFGHSNNEGALFRDRAGNVHVAFHHVMQVLRGGRFVEIIPAIPKQHSSYLGWGWHQTITQDAAGEWWIPTGEGLVRFPAVPMEALPRTRPKAVYTTRDGLGTNDIFRVFEDSRGGIWVACIGPHDVNGLSRWDRATGAFRQFNEHTATVPTAFAEDRDRLIWIGNYDGTLARIRNGVMTVFGREHGLSGAGIQAVHIDRAGRLWIASLGGVARADNLSEEHPHFSSFGRANGLSSNVVLCIAEDRWGRVYLATGRGIDRIPSNGQIEAGTVEHFTEADGLAGGELRDLLFDRSGMLWCLTKQGVSVYRPEPDAPRAPPPVFFRQVRMRGVPNRTWDLGASKVPELRFAHDQNQLQIDYSALAFKPGEVLRYQYKLEPDNTNWSEPTDLRTVNYSNLAAGTYRFSVRLSNGEAAANSPATLQFTIFPTVWQRWWFRLLLLMSILTLLYWFHRYRTSRLVELERVRTRIAGDLHDDIGSGLSQIAILAEVAHRKVNGAGADVEFALSNIGSVSRELAESMSDIVWSINPRRDHVSDLVQRMRRFATDLLAGGGIEFTFHVSLPDEMIPLPAEIRRELYLIFKEAVNNVFRHSKCTRAQITISIGQGRLNVRIEDDGVGIRARSEMGNGLQSMTERARRIHARITFETAEQGGASVVIQAPVHAARNWLRASIDRSESRP